MSFEHNTGLVALIKALLLKVKAIYAREFECVNNNNNNN